MWILKDSLSLSDQEGEKSDRLTPTDIMLNIQKLRKLASLIFKKLIPMHFIERTFIIPRPSSTAPSGSSS